MGYNPEKQDVVGALAYSTADDGDEVLHFFAPKVLTHGHYVLISPTGSDMVPTFGNIV